MLLSVHTRRRLALWNRAGWDAGSCLFVVLLWAFVIGNFGKALARLHRAATADGGSDHAQRGLRDDDDFSAPALRARGRLLRRRAIFDRLIGRSLVAALLCGCVRPAAGDAVRARCLRRRAREPCGQQRAGNAVRPPRRLEAAPALERHGPPVEADSGSRGGNGDRESGRFSQLPADRCALEVRSTTSSTYEFLLRTHRCVAVAIRLLVPPFFRRVPALQEPDRSALPERGEPVKPPASAAHDRRCKATGMPVTRPGSQCIDRCFRGISCRKRDFRGVPQAARSGDGLPTVKAACPKLATVGPRRKTHAK